MKTLKVVLVAATVCVLFAFFPVNKQVPQKVKDAFAKKFPSAKKVSWDNENDTEWEAEFKIDKVEYSANFLEDGTWQETEHEISESEIPQNVKKIIIEAFPEYKIEEVEVSESTKATVYELEIKKGKNTMEVVVSVDGKILSKEEA